MKCENCGDEFQSRAKSHKYCSGICRMTAWFRRGNPQKGELGKCIICGDEFIKHNISHVLCGKDECKKTRAKSILRPTPTKIKECVECGVAFTTTHRGRKYCSQECAGRVASRRYWKKIQDLSKIKKGVLTEHLKCPICKQINKYDPLSGQETCGDMVCVGMWEQSKPTKARLLKCPGCGVSFWDTRRNVDTCGDTRCVRMAALRFGTRYKKRDKNVSFGKIN